MNCSQRDMTAVRVAAPIVFQSSLLGDHALETWAMVTASNEFRWLIIDGAKVGAGVEWKWWAMVQESSRNQVET